MVEKVNMKAVSAGLIADVKKAIEGGKSKKLDSGDIGKLQELLANTQNAAGRAYIQSKIDEATIMQHKEIEDAASKDARKLVKQIRGQVADFKNLNEDEAKMLLHELNNPRWDEHDKAYFKDVLQMDGFAALLKSEDEKTEKTEIQQKETDAKKSDADNKKEPSGEAIKQNDNPPIEHPKEDCPNERKNPFDGKHSKNDNGVNKTPPKNNQKPVQNRPNRGANGEPTQNEPSSGPTAPMRPEESIPKAPWQEEMPINDTPKTKNQKSKKAQNAPNNGDKSALEKAGEKIGGWAGRQVEDVIDALNPFD